MFRSTDTQDQEALLSAARAFVKTVSAGPDFRVKVDKQAGDAARLRVESDNPGVAPAWLFAKKREGRWKALDLGTAFDAAYYERNGIPAALRL
jgi:hypothetical protein